MYHYLENLHQLQLATRKDNQRNAIEDMSARYNSHKLKEVLEGCLPEVTHITKGLLDTSSFCEEWKESMVKPLSKETIWWTSQNKIKSSKESRIHLKSCRESFMEHCNQNSLLPEYQSAYKKEHSWKIS